MGIYDRKSKDQREAERVEIVKRERKLIAAMRRCLASDDGQIVLAWLFEQCGFHESSVLVNEKQGEINPFGTVYNEGRRTLYCDLRKRLTPAILQNVELPKPEDQNQGG